MKRLLQTTTLLFATLGAIQRSDVTLFSDAEERKGSQTVIEVGVAGEELTARFDVPDHPALGYAYAGFQVALEPAKGMRSIAFEWKKSPEACDPRQITLRTRDGKRLKLDLAPYGTPGADWKAVRIPFSDFGMGPADLESLANVSFTVAGHNVKDEITRQTGVLSLRALGWSKEEPPSRVARPDVASLLPKKIKVAHGHGAWIYDPSEAHVARILQYNKTHPVPILHLFVYGASIIWKPDGKADLGQVKEDRLAWFRERLPGVQIWANIDASEAKKLGSQPWAEQERLGKTVAQAVDALQGVAGAHFDVEPYDPSQLPFYSSMKKHSKKPVSAAFGSWDFPVLQVVDLPVLMAYDLAKTPRQYGEAAGRLLRPFLADCAAAGSTGLIGLPFAAAMLENESRVNRKSGVREEGPYKMEDFLGAVLSVFNENPQNRKNPGYGGIAIWAFPTEGKRGIGPSRSEWGYYPDTLKEECLDLLEKFNK